MARQIAKDYDEKRRLILNKAAHLFAEEGFGRASVSSVAAACGISKANIYHYYSSKDEILYDILDAYLRTLRDRICGMDLSSASPREQFEKTIVEILLAYEGCDNEHRLQASGIGHLSEQQKRTLVGYQLDLVHHVSTLVQNIAPDIYKDDPEKLRAVTMSVFWHAKLVLHVEQWCGHNGTQRVCGCCLQSYAQGHSRPLIFPNKLRLA